jgi:TPR repeat protein
MRFFTSHCALFFTLLIAGALCWAGPPEDTDTQLKAGRAKGAETAPSPDSEKLFRQGMTQFKGESGTKNLVAAAKLFRAAAELGHSKAQFNLAVCLENGTGVKKDAAEAWKWYQKAADQGDSAAQFNLGLMYSRGESMPQDQDAAAKWFGLAAAKGHAKAQLALGRMYNAGLGVKKDPAIAEKLIRDAAAQGLEQAKLELAKLNRTQLPADRNKAIATGPKSAEAYYNRAAAWLEQGEFEKAVEDSSRSIELNPQEARSFCLRSEAKEALGDATGSQKDARWALILGPQPPLGMAVAVSPDVMVREERALKALLAKDLPETRSQLAAVRHTHAFAILDQSQIKPGKEALEEAVAYAKSATVLEPENASHWFLTGLLFRKLAELDERAAAMAEQALRQAVEVDPEHAASWLELGLMMAAQDRVRESMMALEKSLENDPARTALAATGLLCAMYALNDEGFRGIDFFQELYASNPEISALGVGAAIMFNYLGDREAALDQARDVMLIEEAGTPEHAYAKKLVNEWEGEKP